MKFKVGDKVNLVFGASDDIYFIDTVRSDGSYTIKDLNGKLQIFYWDDYELELVNSKEFEGEVEFDIYE